MWTWVPAFLLASLRASAGAADPPGVGRAASLAAALVIAAGAGGCVAAGWVADRVGRTYTTAGAMALSGTCAIATGLLFGRAPALVIGVAVVWGITVIADSAQFSAAISELSEPQRVGSSLALQTSVGFLLTAASEGRSVAGYGAPGKGNTLLNHCGIRSDLLSYTVDRSPFKQGKFLPGTHIPIYAPERLAETKPDYILVLPWNLRDEISRQLGYVGSWGGKLVFPIPELEIVSVGCES